MTTGILQSQQNQTCDSNIPTTDIIPSQLLARSIQQAGWLLSISKIQHRRSTSVYWFDSINTQHYQLAILYGISVPWLRCIDAQTICFANIREVNGTWPKLYLWTFAGNIGKHWYSRPDMTKILQTQTSLQTLVDIMKKLHQLSEQLSFVCTFAQNIVEYHKSLEQQGPTQLRCARIPNHTISSN